MSEMNERIKEVRKSLGLSGEKFGERLGVTRTAVSLIESGKNKITDQMFRSICREFNVNEEWLRTGEGEMFVELSKDEEIAAFIGDISGVDDNFKKRFIALLAKLPEEGWEMLENFCLELAKEKEK